MGLKISKTEKVGVSIAMNLGVLAGIAALVKTINIPSLSRWKDFTFLSYKILISAISELAIQIIATSILYLRLVIQHRVSSFRSRSYKLSELPSSSNPHPHLHSRSGNRTRRGNKGGIEKKEEWGGRDECSDKSILGEAVGARENGSIMQVN
ncbi:hypothetical protein K469DRAFT_756256 [Zopfia rhizophila CBS 207.26]|uniref:Uncharacterized protein n=1 Tax=Zopfia rhizophila CBS 207.26 TaxID=1314779 RepID=A0A6A6D8I9_9PEZI|nr:hypothetical protein K469DRAFT_756256 [Zopfia rhizophila CBS 207.26]